jgi:hypothetical protein
LAVQVAIAGLLGGGRDKCAQCGTVFPRHADSPEEVRCWACGAQRQHPKAGSRTAEMRLEAMHHYTSRRTALLSHRLWADLLVLVLLPAAAVGGVYLTAYIPQLDFQPLLAPVTTLLRSLGLG